MADRPVQSPRSSVVGTDLPPQESSSVRPYYDDGSTTIYHGDALEVVGQLPDGSVDMVLTDPPYGLGIGYGRTALGLRRIAGDTDAGLLQWIATEAARLLPVRGWAVIFCGYSHVGSVQRAVAAGGLRVKTVLVWDKLAPSLGEGIRNQHEFAVLAKKGSPPERWTGGNVWRFMRETGRPEHPHQKPIPLLHRIVEHFSEPNALILDPFMGSGSTLRAAKNLGRRAIGVEVEESYCTLAQRRLGQEVLDIDGAFVDGEAA